MTYSARPEAWPWLREMDFEAKGSVVMDLDGVWESYLVQTTFLDLEFEGGDLAYLFITPYGERLEAPFEIADGVVVPEGEFHWTRVWAGGALSSRRTVSGSVGIGAGGFYDGTLLEAEADLSVRLEPYLKLSLSADKNVGRLDAGSFLADLYGARVQFLFSTDLYVNSFVQYDTESRLLGSNTRLHWAPSLMTDLFLVFNYTAGREDGEWAREAWEVLLKFQYTFRL